MSKYTAISFAPVQGFIEKSRKLRDLYGASLILSYLSQKIIEEFLNPPEFEVISPALVDVQEGMPNRILVKGYVERDRVKNILLKHWQYLLTVCRKWVEDNLDIPKKDYCWSQKDNQIGKEKGEWERWGSYTWEVFWGTGNDPQSAMEDLETRKLKRDWIAINWVGESSSLSGTDAIAWTRLGQACDPITLLTTDEKRKLTTEEQDKLTAKRKEQFKKELELFYYRLAWRLDNPDRKVLPPFPELEELKEREIESKERDSDFGKYVAPNERLSIPELVKRLVTYEAIAEDIGMNWLEKGFTEIARMPEKGMEQGRWTGWFMGDGDEIGKKLKSLAASNDDGKLQKFSTAMRDWGSKFKVSPELGRVIYAGGDDFLGVLYTDKKRPPIEAPDALKWLLELPDQWKDLRDKLQQDLEIKMSFSVGFVWAGHSVPQRDILQHCREAEKRAKSLGRDRVTIRVLFNSGQYVQWTCPWDYLDILTKYRDRDGINTQEEIKKDSKKTANWNHIYNDWARLKARHAIQLKSKGEESVKKEVAIEIFDFYFDKSATQFTSERIWDDFIGDVNGSRERDLAIMNWMDDLIQVGWQLCRNSDL